MLQLKTFQVFAEAVSRRTLLNFVKRIAAMIGIILFKMLSYTRKGVTKVLLFELLKILNNVLKNEISLREYFGLQNKRGQFCWLFFQKAFSMCKMRGVSQKVWFFMSSEKFHIFRPRYHLALYHTVNEPTALLPFLSDRKHLCANN